MTIPSRISKSSAIAFTLFSSFYGHRHWDF
jgi:hypothetical protein